MSHVDGNWVTVIAKRPCPGRVKTRLAALLGPVGACRLYEALLADTALAVGSISDARRVIACDPPDERSWFASTYGDLFEVTLQEPGGFGRRLEHCFDDAFARSAHRVVVVASDLATLSADCVREALGLLKSHDLVLGPADDGGYYLIGLSRPVPDLFRDIDWSTPQVLGQTLARAGACGLTVGTLPTECDVDDEPSLRRVISALADRPAAPAANTRRVLGELDAMLRLQETTACK